MTSSSEERDPKPLSELVAGLVLGDLTDEEHAFLAKRMGSQQMLECIELEQTAAALECALQDQPLEAMPSALEKRILVQGAERVSLQRPRSGVSIREWTAWLACAASIAIALGIWWANSPNGSRVVRSEAARESLIAQASDIVRVPWAEGKTPLQNRVTGDVVWSTEKQQGFMRFVDMPVNDPSLEQYQLWIIDPARDDEPIDGGVFDISDSKETIVAINAKLRVLDPTAFAITIEKPGGVVVSTQERLPLLAVIERR